MIVETSSGERSSMHSSILSLRSWASPNLEHMDFGFGRDVQRLSFVYDPLRLTPEVSFEYPLNFVARPEVIYEYPMELSISGECISSTGISGSAVTGISGSAGEC